MKTAVTLVVVMLIAVSAAFAQTAVLRTEGGDDKKPVQTFFVQDAEYEVWFQNFNVDSFTLRGGPIQKLGNGIKLSECIAWTPKSGALSVNVNTGNATVCQESKTFWEAGAYAPLNGESCWSLVLYDARWLKRFDQKFAAGPVTYGKWVEGSDNDALSFGVAAEYRVEGGCFYGRLAHNLVSGKKEFRLQYAFGF